MPLFTLTPPAPVQPPIHVKLVDVDGNPTLTYNGVRVAYINIDGAVITYDLCTENRIAVAAMGVKLERGSIRHI